MFENLKGKKLLYLGGIKRAEYVVRRAREFGIYVIVADYNEDSPAKKVADEGVLVDAMDAEAVIGLCREKEVDGIMTGYADILMPICKKAATVLNLPCYYSDIILQASTDKGFFKELCNKYGVPVPTTYKIDKSEYKARAKELQYPVFVKPLDASGSRGAEVCYDSEMFIKNYENALGFSKKGIVVVEELLHGTEFILDYLIINGNPHLLSIADRYTSDKTRVAINSPNLMILPSFNLESYVRSIDNNVCEMLQNCGIENGLVFFQGYADTNKIAFYEMGCRLGGTWPYIDEYFTGLNPMDLLFNQAINNVMVSPDLERKISPFFSGYAGIVYFLANKPEGYIADTIGIDEVENLPGVVNVMRFYEKGDSFDSLRQTDVRFLSVHVVADSFRQLEERVNKIYDSIDYYDNNHKSLLQDHITMCEISANYIK